MPAARAGSASGSLRQAGRGWREPEERTRLRGTEDIMKTEVWYLCAGTSRRGGDDKSSFFSPVF